MKIRVLLTGASGTVGYEVLKKLYERRDDFDITVFDLNSPKSKRKFSSFAERVEIVYGNISKEEDLLKVCKNKDVVIHLAAIIPPLADEKPELSYQVNTTGTQNLIRLLEKFSPQVFFLYSSSISVYGDRLYNPMIYIDDNLQPSEGDEYAKTKIAAETIIKKCKLDWSIFRLTAIMGGHKISKLMFHQPLDTSMEIATPEDTARAFVKAINKQKQLSKRIFNLSGGESCRIIYKEFLIKSFKIYGLGKLNFHPKSFATKNFHCGFYADGDTFNNILNFRKDTIESYFEKEKQKVSFIKKMVFSIFKKTIKKYLQKQSEPLAAFMSQNKIQMQHYFIK